MLYADKPELSEDEFAEIIRSAAMDEGLMRKAARLFYCFQKAALAGETNLNPGQHAAMIPHFMPEARALAKELLSRGPQNRPG